MNARIAIVGGGIAGLYAAMQLQSRGIDDYMLLEAADHFGGRIETVSAGPNDARFDLGATWFWPGIQPQLDGLVRELGIARFAQHEIGDTLIERAPGAPAVRVRGYANEPVSMRLAGGMSALIDTIRSRLSMQRLHLDQRVTHLSAAKHSIEIQSINAQGNMSTHSVAHVLLALPPRLASTSIVFDPPLPEALAQSWRDTPTWMAPHAKYLAVYPQAFWRERGLSGAARSASGPLAEIHDASPLEGAAAVFGFIGIPADGRARIGEPALLAACRAQLIRLFGDEARDPHFETIKDWTASRLSATAADRTATPHHWHAPQSEAVAGSWRGRVAGIGSEWSARYPGYVAGAIDAVDAAIESISLSRENRS